MKNLMRVVSVFLVIAMISMIVPLIITNIDSGTLNFFAKVIMVLSENILPIIAIALCCYCLERNDDNYFARIIPVYMCISIFLSIIVVFFFEKDYTMYNLSKDLYSKALKNNTSGVNGFASILLQIKSILGEAHGCLALISLLFIIKPNNQISIILKRAAYILIVINVLLTGWIYIKGKMEETLPNVYNYEGYDGKGFNFASLVETQNLANKIYQISVVCEVFSILLLFTTNYAFSEKIDIEADNINYDAVKEEANQLANLMNQQQHTFPKQEEVKTPLQNIVPQEAGIMNINTQLGIESNVGAVSSKAEDINLSTNSNLEAVLPISGPVINETIPTTPQQNNEAVQQVSPVQVETQQQLPQQENIVNSTTEQIQQVQSEQQETNAQPINQNKFLN